MDLCWSALTLARYDENDVQHSMGSLGQEEGEGEGHNTGTMSSPPQRQQHLQCLICMVGC